MSTLREGREAGSSLRDQLEALRRRAEATQIGDSPLWADALSLCRIAVEAYDLAREQLAAERASSQCCQSCGLLLPNHEPYCGAPQAELSRLRAENQLAWNTADAAESERNRLRASEQRARELLRETVTRLWAVYKNTSYAIGIEELIAWESYLSPGDSSPTGKGE